MNNWYQFVRKKTNVLNFKAFESEFKKKKTIANGIDFQNVRIS